MKTSSEPSSIDGYMTSVRQFQGLMDQRATSVEIVLDTVLEKLGKRPSRMLGQKIGQLEDSRSSLMRSAVNIDTLIEDLKDFNRVWTISKHGVPVAGPNITEVTMYKDKVTNVFDKKEIDNLERKFSSIQATLTDILSRLSKHQDLNRHRRTRSGED